MVRRGRRAQLYQHAGRGQPGGGSLSGSAGETTPGGGLRLKIITGHTGRTDDPDFAFAHRDQLCNAWARQKPHDPEAPYDAYDESDDTEERARSVYLKKQKEVRA